MGTKRALPISQRRGLKTYEAAPERRNRAQIMYTAALTCHPETQSQAVNGIEARLGWTQAGDLSFAYTLKGDMTRLRIPPPGPRRRADRLWQHTCFEAFVSVKGNSAYHEFNFAPSGEWAVYAFRRYRDSAPVPVEELAPKITMRSEEGSLQLDAIIHLDRLPAIRPQALLRLALAAVVEDERGMISYWALKHRPGKPDFHHPDTFALEVKPPNVEAVNESVMDKR